MNIFKLIGRIFLVGFIIEYFEKKRKEEEEWQQKAALDFEAARALARQKQSILRFSEKEMTKEYLAALPKGETLDLYTCPIGTWFVCKPFPLLPDVIVVGQVVKGGDALCSQYGAGLSVPDRFVNRYRAKIVG